MTETKAKAGKAAGKAQDKRKAGAAAKPEKKASRNAAPADSGTIEAKREGRYLRAARVLIAEGEDVALAKLAAKADLSEASAKYCLDAFVDVVQALREAGLMPLSDNPKEAEPEAPVAAEPEPAAA